MTPLDWALIAFMSTIALCMVGLVGGFLYVIWRDR